MNLLASTACTLAVSLFAATGVSAQNQLCTTFAGGNGLGATGDGAGNMFDVSVASTVIIQSIDGNLDSAGATATVDIYVTPNSYVGNETNMAAWTLVASGTGTVAGAGLPTNFTLNNAITLAPGSYGLYVYYVATAGGIDYTNGNGTNQTYADSFMTLTLGISQGSPFTGAINPRVWNGCLNYVPGAGLFPSFTADVRDIGPGQTVTFTDTSFTSAPGGVLTRDWDFTGDGVTDATGSPVTWTYPSGASACGPNDVTLTVTDGTYGTQSSTEIGYITVGPPIASFTATPPGGAASIANPLIVMFQDTSDGNPTSWDWDLDGDGNFGDASVANPIWVYTTESLFTVQMRVTNACGTDVASFDIDTRSALCTQFGGIAGWTTGAGFYIDVNVLNPAGLTITALGVQIQNPGVPVTLDVYVKPGTHVGNETVRSLWAHVATGSGTGTGTPNETVVDISDFSLAAGQWAIVIEYTLPAGERFNYNTAGATAAANTDLALSNGANFTPIFSGASVMFQPRNWNGCVYYAVGTTAGSFAVIGDGCQNSTGGVAAIGLQGGGVPTRGASMTFEVSGAPTSQPLTFIMFGFQNLGGIDLGVIGMPGCPIFPNPTTSFMAPTDAAGVGSSPALVLGNDPALDGLRFYVQSISVDPGVNALGATLSAGAEGIVGQ